MTLMRKPKPPTVQQIRLSEQKIEELTYNREELRELLREKTIIESNPHALLILKVVCEFGELPTRALEHVLKYRGNHLMERNSFLKRMITEGYLDCKRGVENHRITNIFTPTPKGRAALKQKRKREK